MTSSPFAAFKVMTFDVVGTLIDFEGGMLAYLRKSGAAPSELSDDAILDAYRASRTAGKTLRYPDDLERGYFDLVRNAKLKDDAKLARGFRDSAEFWPAFPDSVGALKRLASKYRLVAMTNAQRWAFEHFARTLGNPFWDSVTVDDALCEKPDPNFFGFARGRISRSGAMKSCMLRRASITISASRKRSATRPAGSNGARASKVSAARSRSKRSRSRISISPLWASSQTRRSDHATRFERSEPPALRLLRRR
jgi:putative hydrolase of the HAD superfamily